MIEIFDDYFDDFLQNQKRLTDGYIEDVSNSFYTISKNDCRRLLIIGKVQSGKTSHFIGLACKLFTSQYNLGIIFSGTKINLHRQTIERIRADLRGIDIKIISDNDKEITELSYNCIRSSKPILVVCLKHPIRIKKLITNVSEPGFHGFSFVIDDESDQASLNSFNLSNLFSETPKASPTHEAINNLIDQFNPKYIQITATPAAHLLTDDLDYFKPDYVNTIQEHSNYFGNDLLFQNKSEIITIINENPERPNKNNLARFIAQYLRNCIDLNKKFLLKNLSCFIHPHPEININNLYGIVLKKLIIEFKSNPKDFCTKYSLENFNLNADISEAQEILNALVIQVVAGSHDDNVDFDEFFLNHKYFCLIGGGKLERGFTIEGLVTSFIPRASKVGNGDTIQQRARFFGNKKNLLPHIHVFMNDKTYNDFEEYYLNETYLFNSIQRTIKSSELKIKYLADYTNPCRQNVLRSITTALGHLWHHFYFSIPENINLIESFEHQFELIQYQIPQSHTQSILRFPTTQFLNLIDKLYPVECKPLSSTKDRIGYIMTTHKENTIDVVLLGNKLNSFRERQSKVQNGQHIPKTIHQGYSQNSTYIGDSNILLNYQPLTIQFSLIHLKESSINQLVISFKINT